MSTQPTKTECADFWQQRSNDVVVRNGEMVNAMSAKPTSEARAELVAWLRRMVKASSELPGISITHDCARQIIETLSHPAAPADAGDARQVIAHLENAEREAAIREKQGPPSNRSQPSPLNYIRSALSAARRLLDAPPGVGERMRELETIIQLAAMLIQPTDDGPQLIGHESFRSKLMMACRSIALAAPAPAEAASEPWQCPKCKRWQSEGWDICRSEFDTGIPCDGRRPAASAPAGGAGENFPRK